MSVTIYHNPRCSKSRQTLALLEDRDVDIQIVKYLESELTVQTIADLYKALNYDNVRQMMRTKETEYIEQQLSNESLTDQALFEAIVATPKLLERPIVVVGNNAKMGRPPEQVLELL
jgi:arsenate reductase